MLDKSLCQIGFTRSEADIYIELSKIGPQAVSVIAKRISLNRTSAYSILKSLEKKGVVSSFINNGLKYFSANDPNSLVGYVDRQCQSFDYYRSELLSLVPKFRNLRGEYSFSPPLVSYFEGIEGVKHVMYDALTVEDSFCSFLSVHKFLQNGMEDFLVKYKNDRVVDKKIMLRAIVPDTDEVRSFFKKNYSKSGFLTDVLFVKDAEFIKMFENQVSVYGNRVSIVHIDRGEEYGVIINSKEVADMQRAIFEVAWKGCYTMNHEKV